MKSRFSPKDNLTPSERSIIESAKAILQSKDIQLEKGAYLTKDWSTIFSSLKEIQVERLSLYSNDAIINCSKFVTPNYPSLQTLYLSYNRIVSIEGLSSLQAPKLKELVLSSNLITSVRSLRKLYFPELNELDICTDIIKKAQNPILDPQYLSQIYMDKIKLLNIEKWVNQSFIGQSKRWCLRLQVPKNGKIQMSSKFRKQQPLIDKQIKMRFSSFVSRP